MKLLVLGVDHRSAPTSIREALAFDSRRRAEGLQMLASAFPGGEFALLSTCNRVEVYSAGDEVAHVPEVGTLANFLATWVIWRTRGPLVAALYYLFISLTLLASMATAMIYGVGGSLVISGAFQIGTLVAMATLLNRLYGPIMSLSNV